MPRSISTLFCCKRQTSLLVRLIYSLLTSFFHIAIFLVALVGLANFWLPLVDDYKGILEQEISGFLGNQVTIGSIEVDRNSESPRWIVHDLQLAEPSGEVPIHIQQLALGIDWEESLRTLRLQPADVQLEGVEFILRQTAQGLPDVQGLTFPLPGQKNTALNVERQSPIRVTINGGYVNWMDTTNHRTLTLNDLQFVGEFSPHEITVQADALFPPRIGESLAVDAMLKREKGADGQEDWGGVLNTRTQIFNLAALPSPQLQAMGISAGSLSLDAQIKAEVGKPLQIQGNGEITHLGLHGTKTLPAIQEVNATFAANNAGGTLEVKLDHSVLNYPQWFEKPLPIDQLTATLNWEVKPDAWQWTVPQLTFQNRDLRASGIGSLALPNSTTAKKKSPHQTSPNLDLKLQFATQRRIDNVRDYIPSVIIDGTEQWLKTAIVAGNVPKGEFIFQGNPSDFPFKNKPGVFDIRFDIEDGVLAYLPEWPEARDVKGELRFHNAGMAAKVNSATIMDLAVKGGTVDIPDMLGETHLLLDLQTQGDLRGHMDYLQSAPIGKSLRDFMQIAEFKGKSDLQLKLDVPLDSPVFDKKGVTVDGVVTLHNNQFAMPEYQQAFKNLTGQVHFNRYGVDVQDAQGEYHGQPLQIKAKTDQAKRVIYVNLQQDNEPAIFLPESVAPLARYLRGKTAINTQLVLPAFDSTLDKSKATLEINANSNLKGMEIALPAPFGKPAAAERAVDVALSIPFKSQAAWQIQVGMADLMQLQARVPRQIQERAAISVGLGGNSPQLPEAGIVVGGRLPVMDLMDLHRFAMMGTQPSKSQTKLSKRQAAHAYSPLPVAMDIAFDALQLGQQNLGTARLTLNSDDVLKASLISSKLQATMHLPLPDFAKGRVNLALQDVDLAMLSNDISRQPALAQTPAASGLAKALSPDAFPALLINCQNCRKGDLAIQQLTLDMEKARDELQIRELLIKNADFTLSAKQGRWYQAEDGKCYTDLTAQAAVPDPRQLLTEKGSDAGFEGGALQASAQLHWEGAPFAFDLAKLSGKARVTMGKGNLTEVEPGVGRLLGLLDIQRLPSRFSLDFRDMTGKGIAFDEISGNFQLDHGILHTQDTMLKSAMMVAGIKGQTDLVRKTHQQTVTVIPNLRSALPVVGAAVGGIGGGAAMLLLNSLTEKDAAAKLRSSGGFHYRVSGDWQNPTVEELKSPSGQTEVDVFNR